MGKIPSILIGKRRVGPGHPSLVVAELGVNHGGCVDRALDMVDAAAGAGADGVKLQVFRAAALVTADTSTTAYQQERCGERSQRSMLSRLELSDEAIARIVQRCEQLSILCLATPFGEEDVDRIERHGIAAIKIASTDLNNEPLLRRAARTDLPIILSTGASTAAEIYTCMRGLREKAIADRLVLLHCVSCYPVGLDAANLQAIATLRRTFGLPCGLSDHTTSTQTGGWAVALGACLLEKHFTLDRTAAGPDHAMSLTQKELAEYIANVRQAERALGDGRLGMTDRESEVRSVARKSVVAAVDIKAGQRFLEESLTLKRPGTGISPDELSRLVGRHAAVDISHDTTLSWDMVE